MQDRQQAPRLLILKAKLKLLSRQENSEGPFLFIFHWKAVDFKKKKKNMSIGYRWQWIWSSAKPTWPCSKKQGQVPHFLLIENDTKSTVGGATPCHGPLLRWSVTKLQLSGWRGKGRHLKQSLITKTARSQERERKSKVIERAERERLAVGRCFLCRRKKEVCLY